MLTIFGTSLILLLVLLQLRKMHVCACAYGHKRVYTVARSAGQDTLQPGLKNFAGATCRLTQREQLSLVNKAK